MVANLSATSSKLEASWRLVGKIVTENSPTCWNLLAGRRAESLFVFPLHLIQSDFSTSCYLVVQLRYVELENRVKNESKTILFEKGLFICLLYLLVACWCRAKKLHQLWMPHSLQTSRRFLKVKTVSASTTCDGSEFQCDTTLFCCWKVQRIKRLSFTCARLSCILSFRVLVKLCYRIVSYRTSSVDVLIVAIRVELCGTAIVFWGDAEERGLEKVHDELDEFQGDCNKERYIQRVVLLEQGTCTSAPPYNHRYQSINQ